MNNGFDDVVTLPLANTNYNIFDLMVAAGYTGIEGMAEFVYEGVDANTSDVLVGDSTLTAAHYSDTVGAGDSRTERAIGQPGDAIHPSQKYARSAGVNQQLKIRARPLYV